MRGKAFLAAVCLCLRWVAALGGDPAGGGKCPGRWRGVEGGQPGPRAGRARGGGESGSCPSWFGERVGTVAGVARSAPAASVRAR